MDILSTILSLPFLIFSNLAFAEPVQAPPLGNAYAPVNVGSSSQIKNGGLGVNALSVFGSSYFQNDVGVKNSEPNYDLDVSGDINFTGDLYQNGSLFSGGVGGTGWSSVSLTDTSSFNTACSYRASISDSPNSLRYSVYVDQASIYLPYQVNPNWIGAYILSSNKGTAITNSYGNHIVNILEKKCTGVGSIFSLNGSNAYYTGGNVGIGTNSPQNNLHIKGTGDISLAVEGTQRARLNLYNDLTNNGWQLETSTGGAGDVPNGALGIIESGNGPRLTILEGGNVGIGISSPTAPLQINKTTAQPTAFIGKDNATVLIWGGSYTEGGVYTS